MPLTTHPYDSLIPEIFVLGADNHAVIMELLDAFGNNVSVRLFDPQNDGALANAYGREIRTRGIIHGEVWDIKDTSLSELPPTYRPDFIISGRDYKGSETAKKYQVHLVQHRLILTIPKTRTNSWRLPIK